MDIMEFLDIYQEVKKRYHHQTDTMAEKWNSITIFLVQKISVLNIIFQQISKKDERKDISIDYQKSISQIEEMIESQSDNLIQASLIISYLHQIVYQLIKDPSNHLFSLMGKKEMIILESLEKNIIYYINLYLTEPLTDHFYSFFIVFALESLFNKKMYVGIDFEYTNHKIELAQFNFEHKSSSESIIMLINPNVLKKDVEESMIKHIFNNDAIQLILHGGDALDIPYVYQQLLKGDKDKIMKFTHNLIDTRFLCEFYKVNSMTGDNWCSIYDENPARSAVYYFGVISETQQQKLAEILQSLPVEIRWYGTKLTQSQILYAQYDVLYLKYFYYRIIHLATDLVNDTISKKNTIYIYKNILNQITRLFYLESKGITFIKTKCKEETDPANNYFIKTPNNIYKLIDIYKLVTSNIVTRSGVMLDHIMKLNHYRKLMEFILKRIVYGLVSQKCRVYKNKSTFWETRLDNKFIFIFLEEIQYLHLHKELKDMSNIINDRVSEICKKSIY